MQNGEQSNVYICKTPLSLSIFTFLSVSFSYTSCICIFNLSLFLLLSVWVHCSAVSLIEGYTLSLTHTWLVLLTVHVCVSVCVELSLLSSCKHCHCVDANEQLPVRGHHIISCHIAAITSKVSSLSFFSTSAEWLITTWQEACRQHTISAICDLWNYNVKML